MQSGSQPDEPAAGDMRTILRAWSNGDQSALEKLTPIVYDELRRLARRHMQHERPGHGIQATFAVSSHWMRRILVEHARRRNKVKRGDGAQHVYLEDAILMGSERPMDLVALDDAMNELAWLYRELNSGTADGS